MGTWVQARPTVVQAKSTDGAPPSLVTVAAQAERRLLRVIEMLDEWEHGPATSQAQQGDGPDVPSLGMVLHAISSLTEQLEERLATVVTRVGRL